MWDLAGQDRFSHLSRLYFSKAAGALLVCEQSNPRSLEGMVRWKQELDCKTAEGSLSIPSVILANKDDLRNLGDSEKQSNDDLMMSELARDLGVVSWLRTSAKTGQGIEEGIRALVWQMLEREQLAERGLDRSDSVIQLDTEQRRRASCSCW